MPETESLTLDSASGPEFAPSPTLGERMDFVTRFLRRRYLIILICLLLSLAVGALYLFSTPAGYTASATMMIETGKNPLKESLLGNAIPDAGWIESQVGVLKSQPVAVYVAKQLRLADDPQFLRPPMGPVDKLLDRLGWGPSEPTSEADRFAAAVGAVMGGLDVRRIGQSYILLISYRSQSPELALKVANAMVDAYIFDQLNAKYQANRRAGDWLQERLQALREQAATAERAVIEYKTKNNIVSTGAGTLMNEKQLSEISGQLAAARARTSDVQTRLDRVQVVRQALQQERPAAPVDETISEAMTNPIITHLQERYLDLKNREADWSARYGKNHTAVVNVRNQIRDIRTSMREELGRIEETYKSELEVAKNRQAELENGLAKLISQSTVTNQAQVVLFSLEAQAQSYRKLYDNFLQQHTQTVQQQSWPISDARPVSPASVAKTWPRAGLVWTLAVMAGGMLGVGLGAFREIRDRGFRTRDQVRSVLGTECLALVPLLRNRRKRLLISSLRMRVFPGWQSLELPSSRRPELARSDIAGRAVSRCIGAAPKIMHMIIEEPSSLYAEAIRAIKLGIDQRNGAQGAKMVGLTSCVASEGKSSIAAAVAMLIARGGARVALVDCDVSHPTLSRALAPNASIGLLEVLAGKANLGDAVWCDEVQQFVILAYHPEPVVAKCN